jgi:uncharacterized membrane protein (DUF4010 family)
VNLNLDLTTAAALAVAALAGLAVGIEREWSGHASGPNARFAGVRSFLLLGLLGGVAGWLLAGGLTAVGVLLLGAGSALSVAAYVMAARRGGSSSAADETPVGGTTELAALVVLAIGAVSGLGYPLLTSAVAAVMVLALAEKTRIHSAIARIGQPELAAALQFAVLALVILPILPAGPYGPFGSIRPRSLWVLVLIFSGLNFAGYLAGRAIGPRRGYNLTGVIGGLVSSTAVTLRFSIKSREEPVASHGLALGVIGACTVVIVRVLAVTTILRPPVTLALLPYLVPALVMGAVAYAIASRQRQGGNEAESLPPSKNPLGLWAAIKMAVAFQLVLLLVPLAKELWGSSAVVVSAAVLGLTDMDALTLSMARLEGPDAIALGAVGIAVGLLANTILKLGLSLVLGAVPFRRIAATGLALIGVASAFGLWIGRSL